MSSRNYWDDESNEPSQSDDPLPPSYQPPPSLLSPPAVPLEEAKVVIPSVSKTTVSKSPTAGVTQEFLHENFHSKA